MSAGKGFAVDLPVTDLDENIDDFNIEEEEEEEEHNDTDLHDNTSIDLNNLDFGSGRSGFFKNRMDSISNLFGFGKKNRYISRNGDYSDDIELINRNLSADDSDEYFDFDNDHEDYISPVFKRRSKLARFFRAVWNSKLILHFSLIIIISLLIAAIVLLSKSKKNESSLNPLPPAVFTSSELPSSFAFTIVLAVGALHPHFISTDTMPFLTKLLESSDSLYAPYMIPVNPSSKLTNLWSLTTGLLPNEHGIIGNSFFDDTLNREFVQYSKNSKWWLGDPIWSKLNVKHLQSAAFNWPGVDCTNNTDLRPNYYKSFHESSELDEQLSRLDRLLSLEDKEKDMDEIPNLVLSSISTLEKIIGRYDMSSKDFQNELSQIDTFIGKIYELLDKKGISDKSNVMIVSSGGFVPVSKERVLYLEELIDISWIRRIEGFPIVGIHPLLELSIEEMVLEMRKKLSEHKFKDNYEIYTEDEIAESLYGGIGNAKGRISPIIVIPKAGYTLQTKTKMNRIQGDYRYINGYRNDEVLSRSVFIGSGPVFYDILNGNIDPVLKPFTINKVYGIISDSLGITNNTNDILNTDGLLEDGWEDTASYPGVNFDFPMMKDISYFESRFGGGYILPDPTSTSEEEEEEEEETGAENSDKETADPEEDSEEGGVEDTLHHWWEYISDKVEGAYDGVKDMIEGEKDEEED